MRPSRANRTDANHRDIIDRLRKYPCITVADTHDLGNGFPDILVGYNFQNWLFEIKDPDKVPSKRKLTDDEAAWHRNWLGQVATVETVDQVLQAIGADHWSSERADGQAVVP